MDIYLYLYSLRISHVLMFVPYVLTLRCFCLGQLSVCVGFSGYCGNRGAGGFAKNRSGGQSMGTDFCCLTFALPQTLQHHPCRPLICRPQRIQRHLLQAMSTFYQTV
jgi:hypothetical protein